MLPSSQLGAVPASQPPSQSKAVELPPSGSLYPTPDYLTPSQPGAIELPLSRPGTADLPPSKSETEQFPPSGLETSSSLSHPGASLKPLDPGTASVHLKLRQLGAA